MDYDEFSRQLSAVQRNIFEAVVAYEVRIALWETEDAIDVLNRYKHFFIPVRGALDAAMIMGFARVFDRDQRTMSLLNLLAAAKLATAKLAAGDADVQNLIPYMKPEEIDCLINQLSQHSDVLESIKRRRNQRLSHSDAHPDPDLPLIKGETDAFIETLGDVFNKLSAGHERRSVAWSFQRWNSERQTRDILQIAREDLEKRRGESQRALKELERSQVG